MADNSNNLNTSSDSGQATSGSGQGTSGSGGVDGGPEKDQSDKQVGISKKRKDESSDEDSSPISRKASPRPSPVFDKEDHICAQHTKSCTDDKCYDCEQPARPFGVDMDGYSVTNT